MSAEAKVSLISLCFGLGSWITITGFWAELPVLTYVLPESWTLSSQLTLAIQLANIGPLVYCLCKRCMPSVCNDVTATHAQMVVGVASCLLLIFCWDWTVLLSGSHRSVYLLIAAFGLSLLDCTSSVTFLPFMARFQDRHLTPYLVGEGLSGLIPILVSMVQGKVPDQDTCPSSNGTSTCVKPELDMLFGPSVFFLSLLLTLLISWSAFFVLLYSSLAATQLVTRPQVQEMQSLDVTEKPADNEAKSEENELSDREFLVLEAIIIYSCLSTFGVFPSLQPYSTLPYNESSLRYTVIGTGLAYPIGCSLAMLVGVRSIRMMIGLTFAGTLISLYILLCAIMSPFPPLVGFPVVGGSLVVTCWLSYIFLLSYVKTIVSLRMSRSRGENALYRIGIHTQIGSVFGAAFMYLAVNHFHWFRETAT